jgi:hypothetical protein
MGFIFAFGIRIRKVRKKNFDVGRAPARKKNDNKNGIKNRERIWTEQGRNRIKIRSKPNWTQKGTGMNPMENGPGGNPNRPGRRTGESHRNPTAFFSGQGLNFHP